MLQPLCYVEAALNKIVIALNLLCDMLRDGLALKQSSWKLQPLPEKEGGNLTMPKGKSIDDILNEAEQIARVWADNPSFSLGELTLAQLQQKIRDLRTQRDATEALRTQLTAAINETNSKAVEVNAIVSRGRSGFRAFYGADSTQYEQAGGTRTSERKRPARKPKPTT